MRIRMKNRLFLRIRWKKWHSAALTQLVEYRFRKAGVPSSILGGGSRIQHFANFPTISLAARSAAQAGLPRQILSARRANARLAVGQDEVCTLL